MIRGGNHTIEIWHGWVHARVFRREDVGLAEGARFAEELAGRLTELLNEDDIRGLIIDVRDAPTIAGPRTRQLTSDLCARWERAHKPVAFVVGDEAIKQVQFQNLVSKHAAAWGRVVESSEEGQAWCRRAARAATAPAARAHGD